MFLKVKDWVQDTYGMIEDYWRDETQEQSDSSPSLNIAEHRYPSVTSKLLPYLYYDEETQLFFNKHNTGLVYRIVPLTGGNEQIAEQLDSILQTKVSHEFTMQLICVKHNQVGYEIEAFANQFAKTEFENLSLLGDKLSTFYKEAAAHGFKTNTNMMPRLTHTEVFVVIDKENKESERDLKARFSRFQVSFEASLNAAKIGFKRANADDFLSLLNFYLAHSPDEIFPTDVAYDKSRLLKEQALSHDFDVKIKNDSLYLRGVNATGKPYETAASVLTIDSLPAEYHFWDNINNTCNIRDPHKSIPCNHIISVTYRVEEQGKAQTRANRKTRDLDKKAKSDYAVHVAGTEQQADQWKAFRNDLSSDRCASVKMLYNVILFSRPEEKERDVAAAISVFNYNAIKLSKPRCLQWPYFLVSMPFFFTNNLAKDFALPTMMWPISSWNATQYMPLLSDWRGVGRGILLPTMRDQFACIDPFSGVFGTNYNMAVTGTSGGGKSFFIQMLMLNILFNGGDIFIIDIGGSYRKLCEALGGTYLEYSNLAMNPFTHVSNISREIDDIIALFELLTCPTSGATDDDRGTLRQAILLAFDKTKNKTRIDGVAQELLRLYEEDASTYPTARILSKNLQRYCSTEEHGRVFNEPSKLSPTARIIVVDLKEIEDNASIRAPVLLSVISQFQRRMFHSDRAKQKMCVIDEAWSFFTGDAIAVNFITKGFRTGRRHNASFVTITQGIEDYFKFDEARAAWDNSALKLVFLQDQSSLLEHQKNHNTFSDFEMELLQAFPKAKDAGMSQVLIRSNGISSFHRLFVCPFTRVLLSSDGADYQAFQNYIDQGVPFLDALINVVNDHEGLSHAA